LLRYNAICLGNHDFDFGPDVLAEFIREGFRRPGRPPYLSANLDFNGEPDLQDLYDNGIIAKSTVVRIRGEKIGIIGATTENLPFISSPRKVVVNDVLPAVKDVVNRLTGRGINKIILISHLQSINEDMALAAELSGIDIMVARGGDQYPFRGAPFTSVGVSYQQALFNYIVEGLGGVISAGDYPEDGEGRITNTIP
jgi:5'-nucleotidase